MSMGKRRAAAALLLPLLLLTCCGKSGTPPFEGGSFLLSSEDMRGFAVVRPDGASDLVVREALRVCRAVSGATGKPVDLLTDWERRAEDEDDADCVELLVGLTSREESEQLAPELSSGDRFVLRTCGNKILLAASSEALLPDAVDKFLSDYVATEPGMVRIAREIDYVSESYDFFPLARGGEARGRFVLRGEDARAEAALRDVCERMREDYGCDFPICREGEGILVDSTPREDLPPGEGAITFEDGCPTLAGGAEEGVLAAIYEFYALLRRTPDTDLSGQPYVHLPRELNLRCSWSLPDLPFPLGAHLEEQTSVASRETQLIFDEMPADTLEAYADTLAREGYTLTWTAVRDDRSFLAESARYRLRVTHDADRSRATVTVREK